MKTILLIEDDSELLFSLATGFNAAGYTVIPKANVKAALSAVATGVRADLVVVDEDLPGIKGKDPVTLLKQIIPATPVVLLSDQVPQQSYVRWVNGEVSDLLIKPVDIADALAVVRHALVRERIGWIDYLRRTMPQNVVYRLGSPR